MKQRLGWILTIVLFATVSFAQRQNVLPASSQPSAGHVADTHVGSTTSATPNVTDDYVLGAEDVLAINVWKEPEVTRTVPVRPDGKISLPLIGEVKAAGLTPPQLRAQLTTQLNKYIDNVEVAVIVQEARSHKFNVVGEVGKPGTYQLNGQMTVLDGIAMAGGLRDFAKKKDIYILRSQPDGSRIRLAFNYKDVIKGKNPEQNVLLSPRDTIVVP